MNNTAIYAYGLRINTAGEIRCRPDWSWDTQDFIWGDFDLWTVMDGEGQLETEFDTYSLSRGDSFLLADNGRYIGSHNPNKPLTVRFVHFNLLDGDNRILQEVSLPQFHSRIKDMPFFTGILERLLTSYWSDSEEAVCWLKVALLEYSKQALDDLASNDTELEQGHKQIIDEILIAVREQPDLTLEAIANQANYSKEHLIRVFKRYRNCTPYQFILDVRMEEAKKLLLSTNYSIETISRILRYNDVYYFSKQFKTRVGLSPSAFRRSDCYMR